MPAGTASKACARALGVLGAALVAGGAACAAGGSDSSLWDHEGSAPAGLGGASAAASVQAASAGTGGKTTTTTTSAGATGPSAAASTTSAQSGATAAASTAASTAAAASSSSTGPAVPTWSAIYAEMFAPNGSSPCAVNGGCHTFIDHGFQCGNDATSCYNGFVDSGYVVPGANAGSSPLVDPQQSCLCGSLGGNMPKTYGNCVTDAQLQKIKDWLASGAPNN